MGAIGDSKENGRMACPKCGKNAFRRDNRKGFLEEIVFPWFHYYPWECSQCRKRKLFRVRGYRNK